MMRQRNVMRVLLPVVSVCLTPKNSNALTREEILTFLVYKRLELDEELGLRGIMDDESHVSARNMIIVGLWCIQTDPSHRPSMSTVEEMLEGTAESLQIPPKPFLSSPSRPPMDSSTTHVMTL
ncbi:hypothetical protein Vadar_031192 [Vaccinium darrowii]|uniref:Uncharacterized protein n=1 Tax=Vaccinium darrowii TaxID=229202 RepID=A0ACB7XL51_9ERIC|nr:hypothetical protein Vadar_031192 [Vaccinium darrowii]